MADIRELSLVEKKEIYLTERINNQLDWYSKKANRNSKLSKFLSYCIILIYLIAMVSAAVQYEGLIESFQWVSEPILVAAASLIGWVQAKRYSELSESYNLATHDIYKVRDAIKQVDSVEKFSDYVNEAESAFSREHTQWIARQNSSAF